MSLFRLLIALLFMAALRPSFASPASPCPANNPDCDLAPDGHVTVAGQTFTGGYSEHIPVTEDDPDESTPDGTLRNVKNDPVAVWKNVRTANEWAIAFMSGVADTHPPNIGALTQCTVSSGTKIHDYGDVDGWEAVYVTNGPAKGCRGVVSDWFFSGSHPYFVDRGDKLPTEVWKNIWAIDTWDAMSIALKDDTNARIDAEKSMFAACIIPNHSTVAAITPTDGLSIGGVLALTGVIVLSGPSAGCEGVVIAADLTRAR